MNKLVTILVLAIVFAGCTSPAVDENNGNEQVPITNFEECIAAGNPAMESYPRQCNDPVSGNTFTEEINVVDNTEPSSVEYNHPSYSGLSEKDCFDNICLTRDTSGPVVSEGSVTWICGTCDSGAREYSAMDKSFQQTCAGSNMSDVVGKNLCLDTGTNKWSIIFSKYSGQGPSGEFAYTRTKFSG